MIFSIFEICSGLVSDCCECQATHMPALNKRKTIEYRINLKTLRTRTVN